MTTRIHLSLAHMSGKERKYIEEAFATNWVTPLGPNVDGFEKDLEHYLEADRQIVALYSGTAAIHLGLLLLGVKPDDEVICQSFTFAASANPICYLSAIPVFVDSEEETWNMSPYHLEKAIVDRIARTGRKPKAIIVVHLYGMPAKMNEIQSIAQTYDIPILEDAAEALGSTYEGQKCGTFGHFAIFSFNGNKIITTSGGGALVCPSVELADKARFYATQARDEAPHYQHSRIGYNYRMSNICAGIGRGQMSILDAHIARRQEIHYLYTQQLSRHREITVFHNNTADIRPNYWLTCILTQPTHSGYDREYLRQAMGKANIEVRPLWKPLHLQPVFAPYPYYGDGVAEKLFETGLCLPSSPVLRGEDIDRIVDVFSLIYN